MLPDSEQWKLPGNLCRSFGRTIRHKSELELDENSEQPLPIVDLCCEVIKENDWNGIIAVHEKRRCVSVWDYIRATRSQHRFEHERFATKIYRNIVHVEILYHWIFNWTY
jgi:hypothetical protein